MKILLEGRISDHRIKLNGKILSPDKSISVRNHSPDGFSWGYNGSGCAQLALAILIETIGMEKAKLYYQQFKATTISKIPQTDFSGEFEVPY